MTWVQNVDKRTRFREMPSKPHARKFGAAGSFLSQLGQPQQPLRSLRLGVRGGDRCPSARSLLAPRLGEWLGARRLCRWHFAPSADPCRLLLFLCFLFSLFLYTLKINVLFLFLNSSLLPFLVRCVVTPSPCLPAQGWTGLLSGLPSGCVHVEATSISVSPRFDCKHQGGEPVEPLLTCSSENSPGQDKT